MDLKPEIMSPELCAHMPVLRLVWAACFVGLLVGCEPCGGPQTTSNTQGLGWAVGGTSNIVTGDFQLVRRFHIRAPPPRGMTITRATNMAAGDGQWPWNGHGMAMGWPRVT
jgi:hypothetical protein